MYKIWCLYSLIFPLHRILMVNIRLKADLSLQIAIVAFILALIQIWNFVKIKRSHYTSYACVEHYTSVYNMPKKPNNPVYWGFVCVITIICGNYLLSILHQSSTPSIYQEITVDILSWIRYIIYVYQYTYMYARAALLRWKV